LPWLSSSINPVLGLIKNGEGLHQSDGANDTRFIHPHSVPTLNIGTPATAPPYHQCRANRRRMIGVLGILLLLFVQSHSGLQSLLLFLFAPSPHHLSPSPSFKPLITEHSIPSTAFGALSLDFALYASWLSKLQLLPPSSQLTPDATQRPSPWGTPSLHRKTLRARATSRRRLLVTRTVAGKSSSPHLILRPERH
jgi:hypothetical protein